jgi:D-amino peptidase
VNAGHTDIWVKDAHASARNLIPAELPQVVRLIRGWSGHPFAMVQGLDETFDAVAMIGYHAPAGSDASPLAHTMTGSPVYLKINEHYASEFLLHAYAAESVGVPVIFVSGDQGLCEFVTSLNSHIGTQAVKQGIGNSTTNIHPAVAVRKIREGMQQAIEGDLVQCHIPLPEHFNVEIRYKKHAEAYHASFFPGARLQAPHVIQFETDDYFEVMRLLSFVL